MEERKKSHIDLAFSAQTHPDEMDNRFVYEPLLSAHPSKFKKEFTFLGKQFFVPFWVSSMTGGTKLAGTINRNLARACNEFGFGMGLGSCRILFDKEEAFKDFDMRSIIGDDQAFFANLGICQLEELIATGKTSNIPKGVNIKGHTRSSTPVIPSMAIPIPRLFPN